MLRKRTIGAIGASALALGATLTLATPASAATAGMTCSAEGYYSTGNVNYTNSGTQHRISTYDWVIHGESGSTQNNVDVILYRDVSISPDPELNSFSTANAKNGYGSHGVNLSYPTSYNLYGWFNFIFDVNNGGDPRCDDETTRF